MIDRNNLDRSNIVPYLADIFHRRGAESYLGEAVTMSQHMLQAAQNAEQAGENQSVITAALLHDIGHYTGEFPEDYIEQGIDNRHQITGAAVLEKFFHADVVEPVRWHVEAKRYLCAVDEGYFRRLSEASVETLKLQGGPFNSEQITEFERNPYMDSIIRVRKYDDAAKDQDKDTPTIDHYLPIIQVLLDSYE
ncbi:MAG: HD domain-containing protein [Gammaproteobacteria bacterium]|nr:HD domain-containing protein [Gammaproteobacteria bacterium]